LCERYGTVAVFTVGAVDDDGRTAQLALRQCVKGAWAAPKVQIAAKAPELEDAFLTFMIKGETVVAFTGKEGGRRGGGDVLFYVAGGRWQLATIEDPAKPDQWLWKQDTGEAYFGTFNGRADRLVEIVADDAKGRYYYPAKPLSRFRPDVSVGRLPGPGRGVALYDLDGDGNLDVYACSLEGDRAFIQTAALTFEDRTEALGLGGLKSPSVSVADVNGAGYPDIVMSLLGGGLRLFLNSGAAPFAYREATAEAGLKTEACGAGGTGYVSWGTGTATAGRTPITRPAAGCSWCRTARAGSRPSATSEVTISPPAKARQGWPAPGASHPSGGPTAWT
jgi:hypothetical protein